MFIKLTLTMPIIMLVVHAISCDGRSINIPFFSWASISIKKASHRKKTLHCNDIMTRETDPVNQMWFIGHVSSPAEDFSGLEGTWNMTQRLAGSYYPG